MAEQSSGNCRAVKGVVTSVFLVILLFSLLPFAGADDGKNQLGISASTVSDPQVIFFYGDGCSHC
jgi:hypothetical protein